MSSGFILLTLRWYHGGVLDASSGEPTYVGGSIIEYMDVDVDRMSFFKLKDYTKELGYTTSCSFCVRSPNNDILVYFQTDRDIFKLSQSFENGDIIEIYVHYMVDQVDGLIALSEYTSPDKESFTIFNKETDGGIQERDGGVQEEDVDVHCDESETSETTKPITAETVATTQPAETEQSNNLGFDKIVAADKSLKNKVVGDEPVYYSSAEFSVESDTDDELGSKRSLPNDIVGIAATVVAPSRGKGRPRKATSTSKEPTRGRGRSIKDLSTSKAVETPSRGRGRPRQATSTSEEAEAPARGKGRPTQNSSTFEAVEAPARGRQRPAKNSSTSEAAEAPARGKGRPTKDSSTSEAPEASSRGRGRPRKTHAKGMGMPRRTYITSEWFENPTS
ncbi:hypothetical protein HAX54_002376 [Datura stramonium]|uniref:PB1-like domain-containing protein n=1 Tax=Datura stramonium TaxID=4076 RepID=A0ABS8T5Z0_DATST|nr:hypothetical protein [Datura stramonium]